MTCSGGRCPTPSRRWAAAWTARCAASCARCGKMAPEWHRMSAAIRRVKSRAGSASSDRPGLAVSTPTPCSPASRHLARLRLRPETSYTRRGPASRGRPCAPDRCHSPFPHLDAAPTVIWGAARGQAEAVPRGFREWPAGSGCVGRITADLGAPNSGSDFVAERRHYSVSATTSTRGGSGTRRSTCSTTGPAITTQRRGAGPARIRWDSTRGTRISIGTLRMGLQI